MTDWKSGHQVSVRDSFGIPLNDSDTPIDHPLLIREEIQRNSNGEVVKISMIFKKSYDDLTEVTYSKSIIPISGNTTPINVQTIYPWVME